MNVSDTINTALLGLVAGAHQVHDLIHEENYQEAYDLMRAQKEVCERLTCALYYMNQLDKDIYKGKR